MFQWQQVSSPSWCLLDKMYTVLHKIFKSPHESIVLVWSYEVGLWTVDNEFDFKRRALHCTPLEFRTGLLSGAFNLKVATVFSLPTQHQANTTKQLQRPRRCQHLLELSGCPVVHLNVRGWNEGLAAVISCFLPSCGSHDSAGHRHLHPSYA